MNKPEKPKKKETHSHQDGCDRGRECICEQLARQHNETRAEMEAYYQHKLGKIPSEEEIKEIITRNLMWNLGQRYTHEKRYVEGITNERAMIFEEELAKAISKRLEEMRRE